MKKEANCELDRLMMFIWGLRPIRNNRVVKLDWSVVSLRPMINNRVVKPGY